MKKTALILITFALAACGEAKAPEDTGGTVVKEGKDWVADEAKEGDVEARLPDTPVKIEENAEEPRSEGEKAE